MTSPDILILGGGIFGATAALELRGRGHTVALLDPGPLPHPQAESTDISKVVRMEYGADALYMQMGEESRAGWLRWNAELFPEPLYHDDGVAMLTRAPMGAGGFEYESYQLSLARGHHPERLNADEITRRFPAFRPGKFADGFFHAEGGWVESGRALAALIEKARSAGVIVHDGRGAARIVEQAGRVTGVEIATGSHFSAEWVIVAAGAWTVTLVPELRSILRTPGMPVFHLRPSDPAPFAHPQGTVFTADISATGWYGFPLHPREGVVKVAHHGAGVMVEPAGGERVVYEADHRALRAFLKETFPALADAPVVYTRRCVYCDTPDGHFWIDRHPERRGLIVATGGSGHGYKFGPVIGGLIADVLEDRPNPYRERFAWRAVQPAGVPIGDAARSTAATE